jgi:hypothetical protein
MVGLRVEAMLEMFGRWSSEVATGEVQPLPNGGPLIPVDGLLLQHLVEVAGDRENLGPLGYQHELGEVGQELELVIIPGASQHQV